MLKPLCILFMVAAMAGCQTVKTVHTDQVKYAGGQPRLVVQKVVKSNRKFELHENFREETITTRAYYHNGKLQYETVETIYNGGDYACREALYRLKQYDSTGVLRLELETECDCHKQTERTYNAQGKLLIRTKTFIKRLY